MESYANVLTVVVWFWGLTLQVFIGQNECVAVEDSGGQGGAQFAVVAGQHLMVVTQSAYQILQRKYF